MAQYPFSMSEVETTDTYPPMFPFMPPQKKYETPISPKENYKLVYSRKLPVWIPVGTDSTMLTPRIDPDNIARNFVFEANPLAPEEQVGGKDRHSIDWIYVPQAGGSMVMPGAPTLADANDWEKVIQFPDVDKWPWELSAEANKDRLDPDRWMSITILTGMFERLISFMDFSEAAVALIDEDQKTALHGLFQALVDMYKKMISNYVKYFKADCISFHDDWGSQNSPFFSLSTAMEMLVPYIKQVVDHCHDEGIFYDQHSCGKNEKLVPAYIAAGVDSWSGQPMNNKEMIYEQYGGNFVIGMETGLPPIGFGESYEDPNTEVDAAKAFVAKYGPDYAQKPVFAGFFAPAQFSETIYIESRKMFESMR
ncbi:MAG: methyltransferase [Eubacteriaceae bacterium]|nr:methyltransferase [Eubacteriaceae bacterium]